MRETFLTIIVEPNVLFREGLKGILQTGFRTLKTTAELDEALLGVAAKYGYVLLILGPGNSPASVIDQIQRFKESNASGRVAVIADHYESSGVLSAFRAGANAYFVKVTACDTFLKSLKLVVLGATLVPSEIMPWIMDQNEAAEGERPNAIAQAHEMDRNEAPPIEGTPHFSIQERRILSQLIAGDANKTIARKVGIAEATVKVHVKAILRKIRVNNRTQAAVWAMHNGRLDFTHGSRSQTFETEIVASAISLGSAITAPRK
jgi:two-component system, NarL family, nitrate/nitrite response regulator NarL